MKRQIKSLQGALSYDPKTGLFHWAKDRPGVRKGAAAGSTHGQGYRVVMISGKQYQAHRLAFCLKLGRWPNGQVDHINGVRSDNRWCNLREATHAQNQRNQKLPSNNTTGVIGVYYVPETGGWRAMIGVNGSREHLGHFSEFDDAVRARKRRERELGYHENHGRTP